MLNRRTFIATAALTALGAATTWNFLADANRTRANATTGSSLRGNSTYDIDSSFNANTNGANSIPTTAAVKNYIKEALENFLKGLNKSIKIDTTKLSFKTVNNDLQSIIEQIDVLIEKLAADLSGKADKVHTHAIADVSGLQAALDAKLSNFSVTDLQNQINNLLNEINGKADVEDLATKANLTHTHFEPTHSIRCE